MSEVNQQEAPKPLSILEQLKQQHAQFLQQKEMAQNNMNQLIGAIYASEIMIKKHEEEAKKGDCGDVDTDKQETECAS